MSPPFFSNTVSLLYIVQLLDTSQVHDAMMENPLEDHVHFVTDSSNMPMPCRGRTWYGSSNNAIPLCHLERHGSVVNGPHSLG